jgi:iron complex transport system substrate-binding protein
MIRVKPNRTSTSLVALAVSLVLVAACGDDDDPATAPTSSAVGRTESTAAAPATSVAATTAQATGGSTASVGATRTVVHELGTSEVPVDPQRVVVVDRRGSLAFLLELGVEPVGALEAAWLFGEPFHPLIQDRADAAGVQPIDSTDGPNLEQIAGLAPDLIIGNVRDMGETADELAAIAPTIGLAWNFVDPLDNARIIGDAVARPDEAAALVAQFETSLAAAAAEITDPGTVSIIGLFAIDDIRIYREHNLYGALTEQLGGEVVPTETELPFDPADNEVNAVSLEQLGMAAGERVISFVNVAPEADAAYRAIEAEALVQALPGFQAGQVLEADPQLAFGAAGVTGIQAMLDQLVAFYAA